jgi:hypothetical protein
MDRAPPWRLIAAVVGALAMVIIAFRAPFNPDVGRASAESVRVPDGAAVTAAGPGVVTTPETQPAIQLPQPTADSRPSKSAQ